VITLVLGGTRSGKSAVAETLARRSAGSVTYIATGVATDEAMAARIQAHRERRPRAWDTVEAGADLAAALRNAPAGTAIVDALGTWVAAHHDFDVNVDDLLDALASRAGDTVIVSDEVGLGVHPSTEAGRRFRDTLGLVNRAVADRADDVLLVVAGRTLRLSRLED
jgi:adenosyl cobinamide kinase/adenosyl cobinamide phosphate guanylyltransferase